MGLRAGDQRGSVLIIAVIAMLIMGVLSVSFALLADIETKIGVNYKQQAQAEALAEAGLEVARDAIRGAVGQPAGFTSWIGGPLLASGVLLGPGHYWARIDNDCPPLVPAAIQQSGCPTNTDSNQTAVLTAWAVAGTGRARVRAVVGVDNPWKHVCSGAKPDNNGYCNDPSNENGNPVIRPADPNDPNGPAAYDDLPRPILGCSRIDPAVHGAAAWCATAPMPKLFAQPATGPYPAYPPPPSLGGPRLVLMGEDPDLPVLPGAQQPKTCYDGGVGFRYFGYFDCALSTPCIPAGLVVPVDPNNPSVTITGADYCPESGSKVVRGCVKDGDVRATLFPNLFRQKGPNGCLGAPGPLDPPITTSLVNASPAVGMVFNFAGATGGRRNPAFTNVGTCPTPPCPPNAGGGRNIYVLGGTTGGGDGVASIQSATVRGTLVVEGNGSTSSNWCTGPNRDVALLNKGTLTTEERHLQLTALPDYGAHRVYGYPLALVVYDPTLPYPTVSPTYAPQPTCADMGSSNTLVNGMVYSGGHVQFNPISVNGSVVGFELQTQGGANAVMNYNLTYGNAAPPPGFPAGSGNQVIVIRKSFIVCATYNDESGGATACN